MNDWSRALRGVGARPTNTPAANAKTRATILGDVNGLSREAIEALPAAIYMTDAEGRLTFYNEAAADALGLPPRAWREQVLRFLEALLAGWHAAAA